MIKMKCQWFQLTAGNHREDPHQTGRLPAAGFRHSKCAAAAILCKSFMNTILDATNWLFWQFPQRSDEDVIVLQRQHDPLIASLAFGPSLWCGEWTRGISAKIIVKMHPVDPQPLEHGVIAPRELNDGQALFSVSHHRMVHPNSVVDCFGCSTGTTRGDTGSAASDWPWA